MEFTIVLCSELCSVEEKANDDLSLLQGTLKILQESGSSLIHIESRSSKHHQIRLEYFFTINSTSKLIAMDVIRQLLGRGYSIIWTSVNEHMLWFPKSFDELGRCCKSLYKYGSQLSTDHPGYGDSEYERRRMYFTEIATNYKLGDVIPIVEYTEKERDTWHIIYTHQQLYYPTNACREQNVGMSLLKENAGYCAQCIPQLETVSQYLKKCTGYQLCPVVGWIHSRDFLALLAFRVFPCTQYIRHHSKPHYTPEPDICHELLGHVPLFCDAEFADFSQNLGLASLGASDEWITKLSTLYWFTVEFGMVYEDGLPKAYGAGLLSSCEEIKYCITDEVERRPLVCSEASITSYPETGLQTLYYIANSISDVKEKMIVIGTAQFRHGVIFTQKYYLYQWEDHYYHYYLTENLPY